MTNPISKDTGYAKHLDSVLSATEREKDWRDDRKRRRIVRALLAVAILSSAMAFATYLILK